MIIVTKGVLETVSTFVTSTFNIYCRCKLRLGYFKTVTTSRTPSTPFWTREICRLRETFYTLTDLISHPLIIIDGISLFTDLMQKCSNKG